MIGRLRRVGPIADRRAGWPSSRASGLGWASAEAQRTGSGLVTGPASPAMTPASSIAFPWPPAGVLTLFAAKA